MRRLLTRNYSGLLGSSVIAFVTRLLKTHVPQRFFLMNIVFPNSFICGVGWRIVQKISNKIDFCYFYRGVLFLNIHQQELDVAIAVVLMLQDPHGFRKIFIQGFFTDHQVQFFNGFAIFHTPQGTQEVWKIAEKHNPIVKFGCENPCIKVYFFYWTQVYLGSDLWIRVSLTH